MFRTGLNRALAVGLLCTSTAAPAVGWKGEAAAGLLLTSGNSETQSLNGKLVSETLSERWKNRFSASGINTGDEDGTTAERYTAGDQVDYNVDPHNYAFVAVDWERDLFGGFRERTSETLGYGRHLLTGPVHVLDAEIGAGARQAEAQDTGEQRDEFIGRIGGKYQWTLSATSQFLQAIKVESGSENTFSESITELKLAIIGNLFLSVSFTARNNSDVPPETKNTDTFTAVSLSYAFERKE